MTKIMKYYEIKYPDLDYNYVYSALNMEEDLVNNIKGKELRKIYVSLFGYMESAKKGENLIDCSYMGGPLFLIFDDIVLYLVIHAEGVMEYHFLKKWEVKIYELEEEPNRIDIYNKGFYYDISSELALKYESQKVEEIVVDKVDTYAFVLRGFDKEKGDIAMSKGDMPANVLFGLKNNNVLELLGDCIEYYLIKMSEKSK